MKTLKHLISYCFLLVSTISAIAQSGYAGSITWALSTDTLTIGGTGAIVNYDVNLNFRPPWYNYRTQIKHIEINEGITNIGKHAFCGCSNLISVNLPESLTGIISGAFHWCTAITYINCYALEPPYIDSQVFSWIDKNACILYVPKGTHELYQAARGWRDFDKIVEFVIDLRKMSVNLPDSIIKNNIYKNLSIEVHKDANQLFSLTTGNSGNYSFNVAKGIYNVKLKNRYGDILGQINDMEINDMDTTIAFPSIVPLYTIKVNIAGTISLSGKPVVKWYNEDDMLLQQGDSISGVVAGMKLKYHLEFNEEWGKVYLNPPATDYMVITGSNMISVQLQKIPKVTIQGIIKNKDGLILSNALITITQVLNGKFFTTKIINADNEGKFSTLVFNDSTILSVSSHDYFSVTLALRDFTGGGDLGVISLSPIIGPRITLNLTYTKSVHAGDTPITENGYYDYMNVDYRLFNKTKNKEISQFVIQYPEIVLLEPVDTGDEIEISALSRTNMFDQVQNSTTLDVELHADVRLNIVQRGYIKASFSENGNTENSGILYNAEGKIVKQYDYVNSTIESNVLPDGSYVLVSMAKSRFFNSVLNLSALPTTGLVKNIDYIEQHLVIKSGEITEINVPAIPPIDESKLYYTGNKTLFSVNKTTITTGNYLTLRAEVDFKEEYTGKVSNIKLVVDIPEQCVFESNSVIVGNIVSGSYSFAGNRLTVPFTDYANLVRFCIVPVSGGNFAPNAFVQFDLDGKTITQPIGAATFKAEDLSIFVPEITIQKEITVRGVVQANSKIKIYDGEVLIGQTQALASGDWLVKCELHNPQTYSFHDIHAEVVTPESLILQTETKQVRHDISAIVVSKVTMINVAHTSASLELREYITVFDFQNPAKKGGIYWYWPQYPDFTFMIEFSNNDPNLISDVRLNVLTSAGDTETLTAAYDKIKKAWVATGKFDAYRLPVNVSVRYKY